MSQGPVLGLFLFITYVNNLYANLLSKIAEFTDKNKLGHKLTKY